MSKSLTNKLYLKQKLYGLKMMEDSNVSQHLNVFNQIINDLIRVNVKFEDEGKALMLLNFLPASPTYEKLVTTLMWGKETLDLEEITSALLGFQMKKKASDKGTQGEWLVVKGNQERGRSNTRNGSSGSKS